MQTNAPLVCLPEGYLGYQGYDISGTRALIPRLQKLLKAFRDAEFPVYHTREGMHTLIYEPYICNPLILYRPPPRSVHSFQS
jgi:hypothetical protein